VSLAPGDSLVLYSDGLTEAHNSAMEQFGSKRLVEYLARAAGEQAGKLHDGIRARVRDFVGDAPRFDDLTLMVAGRQ
jgi:phosphoserine phosphatase RsbU/P